MTALLAVLGAALIAAVVVDVPMTALAPSSRGPLSHGVSRALWTAARSAPRRARRLLLPAAGPASVIAAILVWLALLWLGFALIYLALIDDLEVTGGVPGPAAGMADALYFSGTALTTLGIGDLVPDTQVLRALAVLEAAGGLSVFTASIAYLPAIYTLVSELRASNQAVFDLDADDPQLAADAVLNRAGVLDRVQRDVVGVRQHLLRFPVLYYFHPAPDESPLALLRGSVGLAIIVAWSVDQERVRYAASTGLALRRALDRLLDDMRVHVRARRESDRAEAEACARRQIETGRAAVRERDPELAAIGPPPPDAVTFLCQANAIIAALADMHEYPPGLPFDDE